MQGVLDFNPPNGRVIFRADQWRITNSRAALTILLVVSENGGGCLSNSCAHTTQEGSAERFQL